MLILNKDEIKTLSKSVGGLSKPSKMPCEGYSLPAQKCLTGSKLRKAGKSTCANCYALKGFYNMPTVKSALNRRFEKVTQDLDNWRKEMTLLIYNTNTSGFFRWHDSGDLQSIKHLQAINTIARALPDIKFWLPTREYKIVKDFQEEGYEIAENLTVRLSAYFKNSAPPLATAEALGVQTSTVDYTDSYQCDASQKNGQCLRCRACWDKSITNVNYPLH
jgi:hypothetical protein